MCVCVRIQRKSGCCCPLSGATTTAQEAGAIPVTLGPPNIKAFAPNAHSYLNAHDFDRCVVVRCARARVCCMQCYVYGIQRTFAYYIIYICVHT